jgi:hypothetical protein
MHPGVDKATAPLPPGKAPAMPMAQEGTAMRMIGDNAMLEASATAQAYAQNAVNDLCSMLGIDRRESRLRSLHYSPRSLPP